MSKENNLTDFLTDVASAIKDKRGTGNPINAQDFASEIRAIEPLLDTINITKNGEHDVKDYKKASVLVYDTSMNDIINFYEGKTGNTLKLPYGITNLAGSKVPDTVTTAYIPKSIINFDYACLVGCTTIYYEGSFEEWLNKSSTQNITKSMNVSGLRGSGSYNYISLYIYENGQYRKPLVSEINFEGKTEINRLALSNLKFSNFSLIIPKSIKKVGSFAFGTLELLDNLIFEVSEDFVELEPHCFEKCKFNENNSKLVLPKTEIIPINCCGGVNASEIVLQNGVKKLGTGSFAAISSKTKVNLPETLEEIGDTAFSNANLPYLVVPKNVHTIGSSAMQNITTIYFRSTTPPTITTNSLSTNSTRKYYVPKGCSEVYKTATNWSRHASQIYEEYAITLNVPSALLNNETITYSVDGGNTYQQFTNEVLLLSEVGIVRIKSTDASQTILIGTSAGGNDVGTISNSELTFSFTTDTSVYLTIQ